MAISLCLSLSVFAKRANSAASYIRIYSLHEASENALIYIRVISLFSRSERARECVTCGSRAGGHVAADVRGAGLRVQQQADVIAGR